MRGMPHWHIIGIEQVVQWFASKLGSPALRVRFQLSRLRANSDFVSCEFCQKFCFELVVNSNYISPHIFRNINTNRENKPC